MVKLCEKKYCKSQANFNYKGESKAIFCGKHKEDNMVDVKHRKCERDGCGSRPSFNYKGEHKGILCFFHKEDNMVEVITKKCEKDGCGSRPLFNYKGENKARFCGKHKENNMIDIKHKKCEEDGCYSIAKFNYEWENKGRFCLSHKSNYMVDVMSKKCIQNECKKICNFGYCGSSPSHCSQHKLDYMITKSKRTCVGNGNEHCKDMAIYGKDKPLHCEDHKIEGEICWLIKKCNCGRDKELLNKHDLCGICADIPFYEESKRMNKIKETIMVKYLRNNIKEVEEILADRIIDRTCNLYRPDILYDCGTHIVVIECDENQHKNYPWESCSLNRSLEHMEEKRMYEIMIAYGLPTIFIRWNPDSFSIKGSINKKYNNQKRLEILVKWVRYCIKMNVEPGVIYKKLFYDEYEEENISFKKIEEDNLL
jgi:hypothetical protein